MRVWATAGIGVLVVGGLAAAALLAWPKPRLVTGGAALARIDLPGFAGRTTVSVRAGDGTRVPVRVRDGRVWPLRPIPAGERLNVVVTARRPSWAGWLVGHTATRSFTVSTPVARLRGRWLQVRMGAPVTVAFNTPVHLVSLGRGRVQHLATPKRVVSIGILARGPHRAGAVEVAAAARSWETLPPPVRVSWFPALRTPQLLATPAPGKALAPRAQLTLTFSTPITALFGDRRPRLEPAASGRWRQLDGHTLAFEPSGFGLPLGAHVQLVLPRPVQLARPSSTHAVRTLTWQVPGGSTLRLQQLFAELGYLPLDWQPTDDPPSQSVEAQLAAALSPPAGRFSWRYPDTPAELQALWQPGEANDITRAAVMTFEDTHGLAVDGFAGPKVWRALLADAIAGKRHEGGYSYVFVHRTLPQSLNLWHDGAVIVSSPGNTGVPAAPTQLGTWPVFEHIPIGTMSGTNPDGSHYDDPGIRYISYFHGGDAIHAFNRASFGTPQSLGCVELPLSAAAKVWPYTPIGTLVTIEN